MVASVVPNALKLSTTKGFLKMFRNLSLLQEIRASTWGPQTVKRIDLAQTIFIGNDYTHIVTSSLVQTWFVHIFLRVQSLSTNLGTTQCSSWGLKVMKEYLPLAPLAKQHQDSNPWQPVSEHPSTHNWRLGPHLANRCLWCLCLTGDCEYFGPIFKALS